MKRQRLTLTTPSRHDVSDLLELVRVSRSFHRPWVYPPDTRAAWARYLQRLQRGDVIGYLLRRGDSGAPK